MLRISGMFVLLLLAVRGSLVVSTSVDEIDVESFFEELRNVDSSFLTKEIIEGIEEYPVELGDPLNTLPTEGFNEILRWLSIGQNNTSNKPLEIPKQLLTHAKEMERIPELLSLITKRRNYLLSILERQTETDETIAELVEFCENNNSTELEKFHSTIHHLMISGLTNHSEFRHQFGNSAKQENYTEDACIEYVAELLRYLRLVIGLRKGELQITHLGASCEWMTGDVNDEQYIDELNLAADRSLNRTRYHESFIEPLTLELVKMIEDCEPTQELSDALAEVKELLKSTEHIGVGRNNNDEESAKVDINVDDSRIDGNEESVE